MTHIRTERGGAVQALNAAGLTAAAVRHDCVLVVTHPVGDLVPPGAVLVEVHGGRPAPDPSQVTGLIALGTERAVEQDPAFALRVLVGIAIRALSPAVNDPTTAVQALNHIEAFLHTLGRTVLHAPYAIADEHGLPRLVVPGRSWEEYLQLAVTEIRDYGADATQVCRRLRALLEGLLDALPAERLPAVRAELELLTASAEQRIGDPARRATALTADRQGIGGHLMSPPAGPTDPAGPG
ncbi:DUF2254 family protein [Streptomyces poriticola]|uniref:DUF2254 family protein n=1 Tax=Streptomyces poriticola TaxID=3120506 RepID=UPI002FCE00D2